MFQETFNINVNQLETSCEHVSFRLIRCLFKCRRPTEFHLLRLIFHLKAFTAVTPWPSSSEVFADKQRRRRPRLMTLVWCLQIYLVRAGLIRGQQNLWRLYLNNWSFTSGSGRYWSKRPFLKSSFSGVFGFPAVSERSMGLTFDW